MVLHILINFIIYTCRAVTWRNIVHKKDMTANSTTTWSGQWQETTSGIRIYTTWLLTSQTKAIGNWNSTHVGKDTFHKTAEYCRGKGSPSDEL